MKLLRRCCLSSLEQAVVLWGSDPARGAQC
jgi:hypothetical protein